MSQIHPYLKFNGNCRAAMTFYQECLGGELTLQTVASSPLATQMPAAAQQNILHATLTKDGLVLQAADAMGPTPLNSGNSVSLSLNCSSEDEIQTYFSRLSAGGQVSYPLHKEFWGATFGAVTDKYGHEWFLNYETPALVAPPGTYEIVATTVFDAPRERVWRVISDPKLVPEYWGPRRLTTTVDKMDMRPGGSWRFVQRDGDGSVHAFHGVYHEVLPPERFTYTFEYEGMPGHIMLATMSFEEHDGKTTLIDKSVFQSVADRDGMLHSGMEEGDSELKARLAELLAKGA